MKSAFRPKPTFVSDTKTSDCIATSRSQNDPFRTFEFQQMTCPEYDQQADVADSYASAKKAISATLMRTLELSVVRT